MNITLSEKRIESSFTKMLSALSEKEQIVIEKRIGIS